MSDPWNTGGPLREALGRCLNRHFGSPRPLARLTHRPCAYGSSYPIEELELAFADGSELALTFKDSSGPRPAAKPDFVHDPRREIAVYESLLAGAGLETAICYGVLEDSEGGARGLLLEKVAGVELYQSGDPAQWRSAAAWLADFHAHFAARAESWAESLPLLRIDAAYLRRWAARAIEFTRASGADRRALVRLIDGYDHVVERLVALPVTVIHGEFYPANVLLRKTDARICPIDWEMAAIGPGLIDLAALTGGRWADRERRALVRSYREAAPAAHALSSETDFDQALSCCRLHLAVQWLGWAPDFTPPPEQRHDWLREALDLATRLGL